MLRDRDRARIGSARPRLVPLRPFFCLLRIPRLMAQVEDNIPVEDKAAGLLATVKAADDRTTRAEAMTTHAEDEVVRLKATAERRRNERDEARVQVPISHPACCFP